MIKKTLKYFQKCNHNFVAIGRLEFKKQYLFDYKTVEIQECTKCKFLRKNTLESLIKSQ